MNVVSREHYLQQYEWGTGCKAWNLVDEASLSVKLETMPAGSSEEKHYHKFAQQFFFIVKGEATFEIESQSFTVKANEGIRIPPNMRHCVSNTSDVQLEFLLTSQPSTADDRFSAG